ncbi:MAG: phosphoenolpyruvate-utilizing protein [Acidimicrobiia bacterium]|nr:phosphoenolpyruvate-utilizing protein [Acidimicrobiia bacterium]
MLDRWIVDVEPSPTYPIYTRANAGEVYPDPVSPLSGSLVFQQGSELGWRDSYERYTMRADEFDGSRAEILGCFGGYLYLNMSLTRIFGARMPGLTPEQVDLQYFGTMPGIPPYDERPEDVDIERSGALGAWVGELLAAEDLPDLRDDRAGVDKVVAARPDLRGVTDQELVDRLRALVEPYRRLFDRHITVSAASGFGVSIVGQVCASLGHPEATMALFAGIGDVDSAAPSYALWELSRLERESPDLAAGVARFQADFGSRGPNEWELRSPTWGTDDRLVHAVIDSMRGVPDDDSPASHQAARAEEADRLAAEMVASIEGDAEAHGQFLAGLRSGRLHLAGRERTKTTIIRLLHEQRLAARELGRRLVERGHLGTVEQVFMVKADELDELLAYPHAFTTLCAEREQAYLELFELDPPFIIAGAVPPLREWSRRGADDQDQAAEGDVLTGIPGCPGVARGRARVVLDPADPTSLGPGDVLIAPITDPAWTPLFVPAAAVVVDVGAQISHAVIVSRELGLPCVVSVTGATRRIPDGALVEVDGDAGTVRILEVDAGG